ncbi:hypothetical protein UPYG_G00071070 [Umbra pygmaea]|uniref:Uncharacterized protein n=1 Tax=Umbra pygmaea TaxID=75934 RepID=A0ABD0XRD1_UMBPY
MGGFSHNTSVFCTVTISISSHPGSKDIGWTTSSRDNMPTLGAVLLALVFCPNRPEFVSIALEFTIVGPFSHFRVIFPKAVELVIINRLDMACVLMPHTQIYWRIRENNPFDKYTVWVERISRRLNGLGVWLY